MSASCDAPASTAGRAAATGASAAATATAFRAALARASASSARRRAFAARQPARDTAVREASAGAGLAVLALRRRGADEGQRALGPRRTTASLESAAVAPRHQAAAGDSAQRAPPGPAPVGSVFPPGALEQLAVLARRGDRPSLDLAFGRDLRVTLVRGASGLDVLLETRAALGGAAEAELPALVRALRDRGLVVVRAEVRVARGGALTPRRPFDTTATLPSGTVAKW